MKMMVNTTEGINLSPANELEEIAQNVRTIATTLKGTVPLDRKFGIDARLVDRPIGALQAKLTAEIVSAVRKFEPRAKVLGVRYNSSDSGKLDADIIYNV